MVARPSGKGTSYCWNGTIGGYVGPKAKDLGGKTHKTTDFLPRHPVVGTERDGRLLAFNDAGNNPEAAGGGRLQRHAGGGNYKDTTKTGDKGAARWWVVSAERRRSSS